MASEFILLFIIFILVLVIFLSYKKLKYIDSVLNDVLDGNLNQRIRIQNEIKPINMLIVKINRVVDNLQRVNKKSILNEEARRRMISNISHDLRTPLTSMLGYMELIFDDNTLSNEKKEEYLKIIYNKGNSLYEIMEEFFQVSKLDSDDVQFHLEKINISEIIRQNIISFFSEIQKLKIEPIINVGNSDVYILSDKKIINRILNNLIINIIKHGTDATKMGIELSENEKYIFIEIWDNGVGITEEELNHIFDRLYTVEKSRSTSLKNSGLGLTIVKKLVELLDGGISVKSKSFERTSFIINFPKGKLCES